MEQAMAYVCCPAEESRVKVTVMFTHCYACDRQTSKFCPFFNSINKKQNAQVA